jgi:nucleotide-binding universal stress UspA family protein
MKVLIPSDLSLKIESEIEYLEKLFPGSDLYLDVVFHSEKFSQNTKLRKGAIDDGIPESVANRCEQLFSEFSSIQNVFLVHEKLEDEVLEITKKEDYDLVVSLTDGTDNFMDFLFGTTTQHFVNNLEPTILSIPRNADLMHEKSLLLLYDFQGGKEWDSAFIVKLQEKAKLNLDILHIIESDESDKLKSEIEEDLKSKGIDFRDIYLFQGRNFEEGLMNFLDDYEVQCMAMGAKQRKGLSHLFLGSTAENILNQIPNPIFIFKN